MRGASRAGPFHNGAPGVGVCPHPEGLGAVVIAAQREQVVRRGGTPAGGIAVIQRLTVIEIATTRRDGAPGEAAGAVPQAHQPGHGGAGGIGVGLQLRECAGAGVGEGRTQSASAASSPARSGSIGP